MYEHLRPFCDTDKQREMLDVLAQSESQNHAADVLGISKRTIERKIAFLRQRAAKQGIAPDHDMVHGVPEGYRVRGVSTLYNESGEVSAQWVKSQHDSQAWAAIEKEMLAAFLSELPKEKEVPKTGAAKTNDLLNLYILTDYHLGMKADEEETKDSNWDIPIAEDLLVRWFQSSIASAPDTETAIFAQLGDFLHWDGLEPVTPASGFNLDVDSRYQRLIRVSIRVLRRVTRMLLEKHDQVHIIHAEGNHDVTGSMWLREVFAAWYENEPRVTVDTSTDPYYCYRFGRTFLAFHHGHKRRVANLDSVLAAKFREDWGKSKHCYAHTGHLHHDHVKETNLMRVEQHRTLAAPDAYAARGGWMTGRSAPVVTYHKEYGEVGRIVRTPEMV